MNTSMETFNSVLNEGYAFGNFFRKVVVNRRLVINVCVFGEEINVISKETINKYFDLLQELQFIVNKKYVDNLKNCHNGIDIYIYMHDGINILNPQEQWRYILKRKGMSLQKIPSNNLAHGSFNREKNKTVAFVAMSQMSSNLDNHIVSSALKSFIIQELFQVTTFGIDIDKKPFSILHEFHYVGMEILNENQSPWVLKNHFEKNPSGLCNVDIWFLILKANFANDDVLTSTPNEYKHYFRKNMKDILLKTSDIQSNSTYKDFFDPRCSGKNTGINTKIGIQ